MRLLLTAVMCSLASAAGLAQEVGDPQAGFAYASEHCVQCHAIERNQFGSPFYEAPPFEEIANIRGMSDIALLSFFQTSHELMPNFIVPASDVRDLIAYIRSLKD